METPSSRKGNLQNFRRQLPAKIVTAVDRGGRVDSAKDVRNNTFNLGLDMKKLVVWTYAAILIVNSNIDTVLIEADERRHPKCLSLLVTSNV